jgi:hypothetical protein
VTGPLLVSAFCLLAWVLILAVPNAWLLVSLIIAPSPIGAAVVVSLVALALVAVFWRKRLASGIAMIVGFAVVYALCWPAQPLKAPATYLADLLRVTYYHRDLTRMADNERQRGITPALGVLDVDGFGSLTSGVAYDPTRELSRPPSLRSRAWAAAANRSELGVPGLEARRIVGDYYVWFHD